MSNLQHKLKFIVVGQKQPSLGFVEKHKPSFWLLRENVCFVVLRVVREKPCAFFFILGVQERQVSLLIRNGNCKNMFFG